MGDCTSWPDTTVRLTTANTAEEGGPTRAVVTGELDIATAAEFGVELARLIDERTPDVVLDVSALTFCDARGLAAIIAADELARSRGGAVTLTGARPQLARILRITGLDRRFPLPRMPFRRRGTRPTVRRCR
ncbi:STAS domain-containing protein [Actinomadura formosensis]|uniref:STAS domain-containing protein n=1 Tax=Actinomadura formosensis TaxID=60706 RepID=UPI0008326EC8|nr:STAS domain-containing protein [Actinomadura formosensis]